jgi:hypothetical protein
MLTYAIDGVAVTCGERSRIRGRGGNAAGFLSGETADLRHQRGVKPGSFSISPWQGRPHPPRPESP